MDCSESQKEYIRGLTCLPMMAIHDIRGRCDMEVVVVNRD